jgi:citrate synthase
MGFRHRVYKNYDPRAALVKAIACEVLVPGRAYLLARVGRVLP